jgi:RNA polymerase sigma-70 factor (ECF subfamily)
MPTEELVFMARDGDAEAFGILYDRHVDNVFRFVFYKVGRNKELAQDLTADTFYRALKRISWFGANGTNFGAWLTTIARNLVADHFKNATTRFLHYEANIGDAAAHGNNPCKTPESRPAETVADYLNNVRVLTLLKKLKEEQQEVLVLRFLLGYSVEETAEIMGRKTGAIKTLQHRALANMRTKIRHDEIRAMLA